MPLLDRPDFHAWLKRFEAHHEQVHGSEHQPPRGRCDGCGEPLPATVSRTGLCLVCLAEQYGRDRARAAARIAAFLRVALAHDPGTPIDDIRDAVDEVLDELDVSG
jgi:hypothetical protein